MSSEPQVLDSCSSNSVLFRDVTAYFYTGRVGHRLGHNYNALTLNLNVRHRALVWRAKSLPTRDGAVLLHELPMDLASDADKCRVGIDDVAHKWFIGDVEIDSVPTIPGVLLQFHGTTCQVTVSFFQGRDCTRIRLVNYGVLLKQYPSLSADAVAARAVHHIFTMLLGMLPHVEE